VKGTSRRLRGDHYLSWNATNLRRLAERVNCPEVVQPSHGTETALLTTVVKERPPKGNTLDSQREMRGLMWKIA